MPSLSNINSNETTNLNFNTTQAYRETPIFQNDSQKYALFLCGIIIGIGACCYFTLAAIRDHKIRKQNNNTFETRNTLPGYAEDDVVGRAKEIFRNGNH